MEDELEQNGTAERPPRPTPAGFVEVVDGDGRLLFFFDPERDLVQIKPKGRGVVLIDLRMYRGRVVAQGKVI